MLSMLDLKQTKYGQMFFSPDAMRFFNSRVETELIEGKFFVTSEHPGGGIQPKYSLRHVIFSEFGKVVDITCIGGFRGFSTKGAALNGIEKYKAGKLKDTI
jgi:hypothetical protein